MKQPKFGPFFLACGLTGILVVFFMIYVNNYFKNVTNVANLANVYDDQKFDGLLLEKKALLSNDFLYLLDSSNLGNTNCTYHPSNIFKGKASGFTPYLVGRNSVRSLHHILKLVDLKDSFRNKKVVFIIEPLYFLGKDSMFKSGEYFSGLHAYEFVLNSKIDKNLKAKIAASLLKTVQVYHDPILTLLLKNLTQKHPNKVVDFLVKPIGYLILKVQEQRDSFNAYHLMIQNKQAICQATRRCHFNWSDLLRKAARDGENSCRTNAFGIRDSEYLDEVKPQLNKFRNSKKTTADINTQEMDNLRLLLGVFKELQIKPLLIIEPLNGFWVDYTGLSLKIRNKCYTQLKQTIQKSGFDYVDFSNHEYDKYFLGDAKHLNWKGWVYVDQAMDHFYHQ